MTKRYLIGCLMLMTVSVKAQFNSASIDPYLDIRSFMSLKIEVSNKTLDYAFASEKDFSDGILKNNVMTAYIKSNQNWRLSISAETAYFTNTSTGTTSNLPCSILSIRKENKVGFTTISVTPAEITNGPRGSDTPPNNRFSLDLNANPGLGHDGGSYVIGIIFTLTPD